MYFLLLISALLVAAGATPADPLSSRIYDGKNASILDFPYQVSIEVKGRDVCGGSMISDKWVLTSARCTYHGLTKEHKIRAGTDLKGKGGSLHQVDLIVKHDAFRSEQSEVLWYDVALMRVSEPFALGPTRQPIQLFESGEKSSGKRANVTGFGWVRPGQVYPKRLQRVEVPIMDKVSCNGAFEERFGKVPEGLMCAGWGKDVYGRNACVGDVGGPLSIHGRLAGFVSYVFSCSNTAVYPVLYAEVGRYRDWIDRHVNA